MQLQDIVKFRSDRLFHGAVNIDWFHSDNQAFCEQAAEAFVFHGPDYHGVQQQDVGNSHGHRLRDTAGFAASIVRRCYGQEDTPFTLAIAGYGTGKSHLALTLAKLLSNPDSPVSRNIRKAILEADRSTGEEINAIFHENRKPCLVVAINGIGSFDLVSEFTRQIILQLKQHELSTRSVENLRPRFAHAAKLIHLSLANMEIIQQVKDACGGKDIDTILRELTEQNEVTYEKVQQIFANIGMPIRAIGGESLKELLGLVCQEYCGPDLPFSRLVVLFDEFGKYTEFAAMRSQIAGSGVLQELAEGIQNQSDAACFVGFIQFEINAYVQRVAPEYRNEIIRYIARYELADKSYLSTNLETLIAHLLEKKDPEFLNNCFDSNASIKESQQMMARLNQFFPKSQTYRLWKTPNLFHQVIRKGCWPLSPFSLWLLFHLTSIHELQERSAISLLADVFNQKGSARVDHDGNWSLSPTDIWTPALEQDLFMAEESGNQGALVHAYLSVRERYASKIVGEIDVILKGVVLAAKMGIKIDSSEQALNAIGFLTGLNESTTRDHVGYLQNDLNVLEWDEASKQFDILGDSVSRSQFLSFLRHRVAAGFDEDAKARLFASKTREWCDLLGDLECDFSETNRISTREWRYASKTTCMELLETQIGFAVDQWSKAVGVDEPRGTIIYCYLDQNRNPERVAAVAKKLLKREAEVETTAVIPVIIVLLYDDTGSLGQYLAEYEILGDSLTAEDKSRFKNLIDLHREKCAKLIHDRIDELIKQRRYVTGMPDEIDAKRLSGYGSELLAGIYTKSLPFPFDGFTTSRGNAAVTCQELMMLMFQGKLDYDIIQSKKTSDQNRIRQVLIESWDIFDSNGKIARKPKQAVIRSIMNDWDQKLNATDKHMLVGHALREICLPPYGANIASAGLLFAIYVAPRIDNLTLMVDRQQFDIGRWFQDNGFKKKLFLDLDQLDHVELIRIGEESEEWNDLLTEWEQTEIYEHQKMFYERSNQLNRRIPVPWKFKFRHEHLIDKAKSAMEKLIKFEKNRENILCKIVSGYSRIRFIKIITAAAELEGLCQAMENEKLCWLPNQIEKVRHPLDTTRQYIIQNFSEWLSSAVPTDDKPDTIGTYKLKMNSVLAGKLKTLRLDSLAQQLTEHTNKMIANAETIADAKELIRTVNSWMEINENVSQINHVGTLHVLAQTGKNQANKLKGLAERIKNLPQRIDLPEINKTRIKLSEFMEKIKVSESFIDSKVKNIRSKTIKSPDDLQLTRSLVKEIVAAYEGESTGHANFLMMQQCLESYQRGYTALRDENLNPDEFETLYQALVQQAKDQFDDEEPPWLPDDVYSIFKKLLTGERELRSREWITALETKLVGLADMTSTEANSLLNETLRPPPCLTTTHSTKLVMIRKKIEKHLNSLAVDWLVDKYQELSKPYRKIFLDKIQKAS